MPALDETKGMAGLLQAQTPHAPARPPPAAGAVPATRGPRQGPTTALGPSGHRQLPRPCSPPTPAPAGPTGSLLRPVPLAPSVAAPPADPPAPAPAKALSTAAARPGQSCRDR